ncbi:hypothetical protein CJF30_00009107 [Rutstroemia sp. NJR-2017a BBW]|nr:hypothetical protein CJF30_00009107 [Rutstroemia sp. NJR-2017a BBW]
MPGSQCQR